MYTNGTDWVIATDVGDAQAVLEAHGGYTFEQEGLSRDDLAVVPDHQTITISNWDDNGTSGRRERTARQWVDEQGRGFLCSTEW